MENKKLKDRIFFINRSKIAFARNEVAVKESELTADDKHYLYGKLVRDFNSYPADVQFAFAHNLSTKYIADMAEAEKMLEADKFKNAATNAELVSAPYVENDIKDTNSSGAVLSDSVISDETPNKVNG